MFSVKCEVSYMVFRRVSYLKETISEQCARVQLPPRIRTRCSPPQLESRLYFWVARLSVRCDLYCIPSLMILGVW
jgi:hypothetical protein